MKKNRALDLLAEKIDNVLRTKRFRNQKEFQEFIKCLRRMRYPGYGWNINT